MHVLLLRHRSKALVVEKALPDRLAARSFGRHRLTPRYSIVRFQPTQCIAAYKARNHKPGSWPWTGTHPNFGTSPWPARTSAHSTLVRQDEHHGSSIGEPA